MSSSGATESSTPFSGGGAATDKPIKDEAIDSSSFREGEKVLAFHGPCLYDAKIVGQTERMLWEFSLQTLMLFSFAPKGFGSLRLGNFPKAYLIKIWDEWLGVNCLLKRTDENVQKQEELKKMHAMEKNAKPGYLSQDKTKSSIGNILCLFKQLIDDHECITHPGQVSHSTQGKLLHTEETFTIVETVGEIVKGLRCYFDKALPAMLLYKEERQQYKEVITDNVSPSNVYGAEHLLRLFVKLPEMLSCMHIETETLTELQQRLLDFLRFLQNNQSAFFHSNYQNSEGFVAAVKKEEN
ncbi:hypothetical protein DH2020_008152 [Rehmannia glutinosa]|uniref:MRG domain-containing protein n=1 Tax=Rehmannia glutinosa TaxID=99300 RepID=A0ABR0U056_REHGL